MKLLRLIPILAGLVFTTVGFGETEPLASEAGYNIWFGLDLGTLQSVAEEKEVETSKSGALFGGKVIFSRFSRALVLEGGLGFQASRLRNAEPKQAESADAEQKGLVDREYVETRSGISEVAIRYRRGDFEIGPAVQLLFGADTTYSPYIGLVDKAPNAMGGLAAYYTFYGASLNQRIGLQLMTDFTIDKRQVTSSQLQYYVSIPFYKPKNKIVVKYKEKTRYIVDAGFVNFETNKYEVAVTDRAYLDELGRYLENNVKVWSLVFITSHTDYRGGAELNTELSKNRANAVSGLLNLPEKLSKKIQIRSRASADPVQKKEDDMSMARNRRVEIEVVGAIDVVSLKRDIALIKQKHRKPDTCEGDNCL